MARSDHIRNPAEWSVDQLRGAEQAVERAGHALRKPTRDAPLPRVRRIDLADLKDVLAKGISDFAAYRTDVMFLCVIYPVAGLLLAWLAFGYDLLPLVFPLASGFALIGPVAAVADDASRESTSPGRMRSRSSARLPSGPSWCSVWFCSPFSCCGWPPPKRSIG
jgi:uncharacterized membrane protein